jgi:hypothetical protein
MKHLIVFILIITLSFPALSQTVVHSFLEKHGMDDGIDVISIGSKMLALIEEQSLATPELLEAIQGVDNIQIITSDDDLLNVEYYRSAFALLSKDKDFIELFSSENKEQNLTVKVKKNKGVVNELIILSNDPDTFSLINITGNLNLESLAKYSTDLDFKELKKFNYSENKN